MADSKESTKTINDSILIEDTVLPSTIVKEDFNKGKEILSSVFLETKIAVLDDKLRDMAERRIQGVKKNRATSHITETRARFDEDEKTVYISERFVDYDNIIGCNIISVCNHFGFKIMCFEDPERFYDMNIDTKYKAEMAMGFGIALSDTNVNIRLKVHADTVETGRAYAHALRVLHFFESDKRLGKKALRKNHQFFGNDPGTDDKGYPRVYGTRPEFLSLWKNKEAADLVYKLYNSLIKFIGFTGWTEKHTNSSIESNLVSFQDVISTIFRTRTINMGRGKVKSVKKGPKKPSQSTLLTKNEFDILKEYISPVFVEHSELSKNWWSTIQDNTFTQVYSDLEKEYAKKWDVIDGYARLTTKRLMKLRKIDDSLKSKKKAEVSEDMILRLLNKRKFPVNAFAGELLDIASEEKLKKSLYFTFIKSSDEGYEPTLKDLITALSERELYDKNLEIKIETDTKSVPNSSQTNITLGDFLKVPQSDSKNTK